MVTANEGRRVREGPLCGLGALLGGRCGRDARALGALVDESARRESELGLTITARWLSDAGDDPDFGSALARGHGQKRDQLRRMGKSKRDGYRLE